MTLRFGIDIGGTTTEVVATDGHQVLARAAAPTPSGDLAALLDNVAALVDDCVHQAGARPTSIGCGVPGVVDTVAGTVADPVNLHLPGPTPLAAQLALRLGVPVALDNDVRAAALEALALLRRGEPARTDVVLLNVGTGVAAGIVIDGRPLRGPLGTAGEIGHAPLLGEGVQCECGATGCLEARIAGPALARRWPDGDATDLFRAAVDGDPAARLLADAVADDLAHAIHWLVATTGIDAVLLGGGVGLAHPSLAGLVRDRLAAAVRASVVADHLLAPERVSALPSDHPTGALGAAALAAAGTPLHHPDHLLAGPSRAGKEHP